MCGDMLVFRDRSRSLSAHAEASVSAILWTSSGDVTVSASPPMRNTGASIPAHISADGRPPLSTPFSRRGSNPNAMRRQTPVLLCSLNRNCSSFVESSASVPTKRWTLWLSVPPRRSHLRHRSKSGVGILRSWRAPDSCLADKGVRRGQIATRPVVWAERVWMLHGRVDARCAAREQPME